MYSLVILFTFIGFMLAIEVEFTGFNCVPNVIDKNIVKERFDIFQGFSEITVSNEYKTKDLFFIDLDKKLFEKSCIQRFKAYRWDDSTYSYTSNYYVGTKIINSQHVPTLVELYSRISILMCNDESFFDEVVEDCKERDWSGYDECGIWGDVYKKILIVVIEKSKSFKGDKFEKFKFILVSLLEEIFDGKKYKKLLQSFRDKNISEIYCVYDNLYVMLKRLNEILETSNIIKKYGNEGIKYFNECPSI